MDEYSKHHSFVIEPHLDLFDHIDHIQHPDRETNQQYQISISNKLSTYWTDITKFGELVRKKLYFSVKSYNLMIYILSNIVRERMQI